MQILPLCAKVWNYVKSTRMISNMLISCKLHVIMRSVLVDDLQNVLIITVKFLCWPKYRIRLFSPFPLPNWLSKDVRSPARKSKLDSISSRWIALKLLCNCLSVPTYYHHHIWLNCSSKTPQQFQPGAFQEMAPVRVALAQVQTYLVACRHFKFNLGKIRSPWRLLATRCIWEMLLFTTRSHQFSVLSVRRQLHAACGSHVDILAWWTSRALKDRCRDNNMD